MRVCIHPHLVHDTLDRRIDRGRMILQSPRTSAPRKQADTEKRDRKPIPTNSPFVINTRLPSKPSNASDRGCRGWVLRATTSTRARRTSEVGAEASTTQAGAPPSEGPAHELLPEESEQEEEERAQFPEIGWWFEELVEEGRTRGVKQPGRGGPRRLIAALATEGLAGLLPKLKDHEIANMFARVSARTWAPGREASVAKHT